MRSAGEERRDHGAGRVRLSRTRRAENQRLGIVAVGAFVVIGFVLLAPDAGPVA
jgi:hypothetical protein